MTDPRLAPGSRLELSVSDGFQILAFACVVIIDARVLQLGSCPTSGCSGVSVRSGSVDSVGTVVLVSVVVVAAAKSKWGRQAFYEVRLEAHNWLAACHPLSRAAWRCASFFLPPFISAVDAIGHWKKGLQIPVQPNPAASSQRNTAQFEAYLTYSEINYWHSLTEPDRPHLQLPEHCLASGLATR